MGKRNEAAILIQVEFFGLGGEEALGVKRCVAKKFEERAVEAVAAGFGGYQDCWSRTGAKLRRVIVGKHLEFLDGIYGGKDGNATGGQLVVVQAVEEPVGAVSAGTADRKGEGAASGHFAAGTAVEEAGGSGFLRGAGGGSGEGYRG